MRIGSTRFGYGNRTARREPSPDRQESDAESDLHYNRFRYYDAATGRYVSADPIGQAGGVNVYAYALNDPIGSVDPLGLDVVSDLIDYATGKAVGFVLERNPRGKLGACDGKRRQCIQNECSDPDTFSSDHAKCQAEFEECMRKSGEDIFEEETSKIADPPGVTAPDISRGDTPNAVDDFGRGRGKQAP